MYVHWVWVFRNPKRSEEDSGSWELSHRWLWAVTWETDLGLLQVLSPLLILSYGLAHKWLHYPATVHALKSSSAISLTLQDSFDTQIYAFLCLGYTSSTRIVVSWGTRLNRRADFAYPPVQTLICFPASLLWYHAAYMRVFPNAHIQL